MTIENSHMRCIPTGNLSRYEALAIEAGPSFFALAVRTIEDTDRVVYTVAEARGKDTIDVVTVGEALSLIQAGTRRAGLGGRELVGMGQVRQPAGVWRTTCFDAARWRLTAARPGCASSRLH